MVDWARARRETIRELAGLRHRLAAAEAALADAQAALGQTEIAFDAASERVAQAESVLDAARAEHVQARQQRYAARQVHQRASAAAERLQRRAGEMSERLDRMPPLTASLIHPVVHLDAPVPSSAQTAGVRGSGGCGSASSTAIRSQEP